MTARPTTESGDAAPTCPSCGAPSSPGDAFCEACGHELPAGAQPATSTGPPPRPPCASCGAADQVTDDGYCGVCGTKQPDPHDHEELAVAGAVAITDRGRRHHRNEDAVALARRADGRLVAVVCDGVSMTVNPHKASAAATEAAIEVLATNAMDSAAQVADALLASHAAARDAVQVVAFMPDAELGSPSCTFLAAVVAPPGTITVATLGDCRAYWLDAASTKDTLVTVDDSWAADQVAGEGISADVAYADPRAHMITRWVGLDADPAWRPAISGVDATDGRLLLCSDGLWNYALEPGQVATAAAGHDTDLSATAQRLVQFANDRGGHDNVSVVLVDLPLEPITAGKDPLAWRRST